MWINKITLPVISVCADSNRVRTVRENQRTVSMVGRNLCFQIDSGNILISRKELILQLFVLAENFKDCK